LREIGQAVRARGQVAVFAARYPIAAAFLHGDEPVHIEAGAK
jgi:hypothetical protein